MPAYLSVVLFTVRKARAACIFDGPWNVLEALAYEGRSILHLAVHSGSIDADVLQLLHNLENLTSMQRMALEIRASVPKSMDTYH